MTSALLLLLALSFVRTSDDGLRTEIGVQGAAAATSAVRFRVAQSDAERWPETLTVSVQDVSSSLQWEWTLGARAAQRVHTLRAPRGTYELRFSARHHRAVAKRVVLGETDVDIGTLTLLRFPLIEGRVKSSEGVPVVGAFVSDRGAHAAKTDAAGAFSIEIEGEWPSSLEISYPGRTTKRIPIPKAETSLVLPEIVMNKGSRLIVDVEGASGSVDVELARETGYKQFEKLGSKSISGKPARAEFEDLDKGDYVILISGSEPLQKYSAQVSLAEAETSTKTIRIEPVAVEIEVRRGEAAVPGALLNLQSAGSRWSASLQTDGEGRVTGEVWQRGEYVFAVRATEASVPLLLFDRIDGQSAATVRLAMPEGRIEGRVIDANSGVGIAGLKVNTESRNDDESGGTLIVVTDKDGRFVIDTLRHGVHTLTTEAGEYVPAEPRAVRIQAGAPRHEVLLRVSRGVARSVRVMNRDGVPLRNAFVMGVAGGVPTRIVQTDASGVATLHLQSEVSSVVYVLPADGSFAVLRLSSKAARAEETITVPEGNATLHVHAHDSSGRPIPHLKFVMRYDGELIPPAVADVWERRRGIAAVTDGDGVARIDRLPAGFLELWPARTAQELDDVVAGVTSAAPVQVALQQGMNVAKMTFARKPSR